MKEGLFARTGLQCNELLTEGYDSIECDTYFNVKADEAHYHLHDIRKAKRTD